MRDLRKRERWMLLWAILWASLGTWALAWFIGKAFPWSMPWWGYAIFWLVLAGAVYDQSVKRLAVRRQAGLEG